MTTKTPKKTAARKPSAPATDRARKAASAEIGARIEALDHENPSPKELANNAHVAASAKAAKTPAPKATKPNERPSGQRGAKSEGKGKSLPPASAKAAKKKAGPKKMSALDAAALVLKDAKDGMRASDLIAAMTKRGLWSSPGGKTPDATLYAAMIREIAAKGKESRFRKLERGLFAAAKN